MRDLSPRELQAYLQATDTRPILVDVREPWEYEICALPDTRLVPMRQVPAWAQQQDPGQEYVIICHHGIRSRQVAHYLERLGFERVINLRGGVEAWAREVDPHMNTY